MAEEQINIVLKAFDKTKQAFGSVQKGLDRVKKSVLSLQGALVSLGAGAAIKKMANDIDNLGKTSAKLGIAVQELQALRYAASTAGIETRTLDMAMQRFTRRLAEARQGTGEAKGALEEMGIALKDSSGRAYTQVEVLDQVAQAFSRIQDPADKVRLAFKLFDAEGVSMVNMLEKGVAGVEALREQFEKLGPELSQNQVAAVELANDKFTAMGTVFSKLGDQLTAFFLPKLAAAAEFITDVLSMAFAGLIIIVEGTINALIKAYNWASQLTGQFEEMALVDFSNLYEGAFDIIIGLNSVGRAAGRAEGAVKNLAGAVVGIENAVGGPIKAAIDIDTIAEAENGLLQYSKTAGIAKTNLNSLALEGVKRLEDSLVDLISGTKSVSASFKDMARSIINDLIRIQIQKSITAPLAGMLGNLNLFGGGSSSTATVGGPIPPVPQFRALGGSVKAGQPYTVGEHGREMFIPNTNGQIVSNDKLGGGVTINQTIQVTTGVQQTVRAEIMGLMPQIANASKAAVLDAKKRGGSFAGAF